MSSYKEVEINDGLLNFENLRYEKSYLTLKVRNDVIVLRFIAQPNKRRNTSYLNLPKKTQHGCT